MVAISLHDARNSRVDVLWVVLEIPVEARMAGSSASEGWHGRLLGSACEGRQYHFLGDVTQTRGTL